MPWKCRCYPIFQSVHFYPVELTVVLSQQSVRKKLQKEGKNLNTFSFDFVNNHKYFKSNAFQPSEDRPWVDKMVDHAKTDHRYLECDNENMIENLYKAVDARDLPCMADVESSMLLFLLRKL